MKETKKSRFLKKLDLSQDEKDIIVKFFTKYPQYEKCIDWNQISRLSFQDFKNVFEIAEKSKKNIKRKAKENPTLLLEKYRCKILCQTKYFLIAVPLDWECAVFLNSFECGGEGAKWCIGDRNNPKHWVAYSKDKNIFAFVLFTEKHPVFGKKILLQYNFEIDDDFVLWLQNDKAVDGGIYNIFKFLHKARKKGNLLYKKSLAYLWHYHLLYEKEREKQLFFDFDIFSKIKVEDKISKYFDILLSLFSAVCKEVKAGYKEMLQKIYFPEYYVDGTVLTAWNDIKAREAVIPHGITAIGKGAFAECENLTSINIPNSVTSIGDDAFAWCENLTSINIPNSVTSIGDDAFRGCENLTSINIPNSVTAIGSRAFCGCKKLTSINIPGSVTAIGDYAFFACFNLTSINIPSSVTSIGDGAFRGCENLTSINMPNSVTSIDGVPTTWEKYHGYGNNR